MKMKEKKNYFNQSNTYKSNSSVSIIYVTDNTPNLNTFTNPLKPNNNTLFSEDTEEEIYDKYALFFLNSNTALIPQNVKRNIQKQIPKSYLNKIDTNRNIAVEKCLLFVANLSSTILSGTRWKSLSSKILNEQLKKGRDNTRIYPHVVEALKYHSETTKPIIEIKKNTNGTETYQVGVESKSFAFLEQYFKSDLVKYNFTNEEIIARRNKFIYKQIIIATKNDIAYNLLQLYPKIDLPSLDEIKSEANRLIKLKYQTKKGKILTKLNKHSKEYFKDHTNRSFVEENIKKYKLLTENSFMIPTVGDYKSGGRVVDSFTLMSSWIRKLIKIDGEPIVEIDFKAFHPNLVMSIYGGSKKFLTHLQVAKESNIDINEVKIQHLSFFNKTPNGMKRSPLYDYYKNSEPEMLDKLENEKYNSQYKHKITSMKLFAKEVEIMAEIIKILNASDIYVMYVYDALYCKQSEAEFVKNIMNEVVLDFDVYTTAE